MTASESVAKKTSHGSPSQSSRSGPGNKVKSEANISSERNTSSEVRAYETLSDDLRMRVFWVSISTANTSFHNVYSGSSDAVSSVVDTFYCATQSQDARTLSPPFLQS